MDDGEKLDALIEANRDELAGFFEKFSEEECEEWKWDWTLWGRTAQRAPDCDWRIWLVVAGRGFGKTRLGAEWVRQQAENDPDARIALVAASLHEARSVMVEGESGLLSIGMALWRFAAVTAPLVARGPDTRTDWVGLPIQTILALELNGLKRSSAMPAAALLRRLGQSRCSCYVLNEPANVNQKVPIWLIKPPLALLALLAYMPHCNN